MSHPSLFAAAALIGLSLASPVRAESLVDRANRAAAAGPVVLEMDAGRGQFIGRPLSAVVPAPGERIVNAVPVPHVMNGGGFGLTGTDYYNDGTSEGGLGRRHRVNEQILAPALRAQLH
ncbi:hypothetical protein [Methylobacterium gnaphalii]|uniref:Uncharacterized protein n=1 Tax=Methylobacterium gnaphalii TaxID=1010610 RepID=A0A512JIE9_9HYPH|nr:hypothetical protein [Methylobacterium gnaphalii]GEP09735.1 hypothetical protein MGN01_15800 [Methylobacterium gnaphalii]GJD69849.1 hypothetical protein MMMDOFMJ_2787 [Methylobacterium gnaphalii]GLS50152.1 hypothetical protein GCM10007885_30040 [Methylobacterium gnaphalii]